MKTRLTHTLIVLILSCHVTALFAWGSPPPPKPDPVATPAPEPDPIPDPV
ncbi:MAG: hypothetical protein HN623_01235, partial [Bdellovibrionales bacterium]|nr:hypothetical protein [Bdellovibrionales bacterium]